jgi:aromatic-amino-acid transaminase
MLWQQELAAMRGRIQAMRTQLRDALRARLPQRDWNYLVTQRGMFSYTGLTGEQVDALRERHAIYLVRSGRMCMTGLTSSNAAQVAGAMAAVLHQ